MGATIRRMIGAFVALIVLSLAGSSGYYVLGHGRWGVLDCMYMAVVTISTVGFAELPRMGEVPGARAVTVSILSLIHI